MIKVDGHVKSSTRGPRFQEDYTEWSKIDRIVDYMNKTILLKRRLFD